ncbi:hypothetical protein EST38_g11641 [Candolleomyces aberdarensis]|uniref:Uncharacterized protein n=1 Tax=Candolleomyces aberdarensis TaxID=2316362 RepID=A0A4Q2D6P2_9AGAR|nr:hypothetical protein EST38_g11641 [Candolleomyces aberdarensis]
MIPKTVFVALAATAATVVEAQDGGGAGSFGITPCIAACVGPAATANGCSHFCAKCQHYLRMWAVELEVAVSLQSSQCGGAGITASGTAGPPKSLTFTSPTTQLTAGSSTTSIASTTSPGGSSPVTTTDPSTIETSPVDNSAAQTAQRVGWAGLALCGALAGLNL